MKKINNIFIPKWNTERKVNYKIIKWILKNNLKNLDILDVPSWNADLIKTINKIDNSIIKKWILIDKYVFPNELESKFFYYDYDFSEIWKLNEKFDLVFSVSWVMEFDNISLFIKNLKKSLKKGWKIIITNDNVISLKDRLLYLFFWKIRRFRLFLEPNQPTFHNIPIQEIYKYLIENGLFVLDVKYCWYKKSDLLFFILFFYLYIPQILYIILKKSYIPLKIRYKLFPISSLFTRHYIMYITK